MEAYRTEEEQVEALQRWWDENGRSTILAVVVALAALLLAPLAIMAHAPGPEMAFHTTAARAALWRDGLPVTYQPLLPLGPFGAHPPALATLAA